jgi:hypothetical protein
LSIEEDPMRPTATQCIPWRRCLPGLVALALLVPNSGCLVAAITAGAAGAGAGGYFYVHGEALHDYNANFDQTWAATLFALKDLQLPVLKADHDKDSGTILCQTGDGDKIKITLEGRAARIPAEGQWTHLGIRVALWGDTPLSERIIAQIGAHLVPVGPPGPPLPAQTGPPPLAAPP